MFLIFGILSTLTITLVLDLIWIRLNATAYNKLVQNVQKDALQTSYSRMAAAYLFVVFSMITILVPNVIRDSYNMHPIANAIRNGAVLGCSIYGIYNFTNYAIFKNYDINIGIMDTVWGTFLYFIAALSLSFYIHFQP
jgi:uncharacterized membrane protein